MNVKKIVPICAVCFLKDRSFEAYARARVLSCVGKLVNEKKQFPKPNDRLCVQVGARWSIFRGCAARSGILTKKALMEYYYKIPMVLQELSNPKMYHYLRDLE